MKLVFEAHEHTEQGQRQQQNDRVLTAPLAGGLLVAVMDGVGSHDAAGDAADTVRRVLARHIGLFPEMARHAPPAFLDAALSEAREQMLGHMGATTCTALLINENGHSAIAHIGDCIAFHWRSGGMAALTKPDRASRHVLTHALHGYPEEAWRASPKWKSWVLEDAEPGDVYLVASDGCYEAVPEAMLRTALSQAEIAPELNIARQLVQASLAGGSTDNSTAVVVRVRAG